MVGTVAPRRTSYPLPGRTIPRSHTPMTHRLPRGFLVPLLAVLAALGPATAAAQVPPNQQADMAVNAARKAYNDGNLPAARDLFKQFLAKFGNTPQATAARYGLALCLIN